MTQMKPQVVARNRGRDLQHNGRNMNKRKVGNDYEQIAEDYLVRQGYVILARNYRNRIGEIDRIAREGNCICFIEVKYRASRHYGQPQEAVNLRKQKNICKVARFYLMCQGLDEWTDCRFDVVSIVGNEIELIRNAYEFRE